MSVVLHCECAVCCVVAASAAGTRTVVLLSQRRAAPGEGAQCCHLLAASAGGYCGFAVGPMREVGGCCIAGICIPSHLPRVTLLCFRS